MLRAIMSKHEKSLEDLLIEVEKGLFKEKVLRLDSQDLRDEHIEHLVLALNHNPNIYFLALADNDIGDEGAKILARLQHIRGLDLTLNQITSEGAHHLSKTNFKRLKLSANFIQDTGISFFANSTALLQLDAEQCGIGDEGAKTIFRSLSLITLNLQNNNITDEGLTLLINNTTLQELNLSQNFITKVGVEKISQNISIRALNLSNNSIGDEGAKVLVTKKNLIQLNLAATSIGNEAACELAKSITLKNLILLNNTIGSEGAKKLLQNDVLTDLSLAFNKIDQSCSAEIISNRKHFNSLDLDGNFIPTEILTSFRLKRAAILLKEFDQDLDCEVYLPPNKR